MISERTRSMMQTALARTYEGAGAVVFHRPGTVVVDALGTSRGLVQVNAVPLPCRAVEVEEKDRDGGGDQTPTVLRTLNLFWQGADPPRTDWVADLTDSDGASMGRWAVSSVLDGSTGELLSEWQATITQKVVSKGP